ncbi:hypothetical protein [Subtercola sp. YIM 133946]|uniref:hypothetical protein n=1 Tax=Subtercola sp. YIM 133946 TaxID=3118909 RepID=UPI002F925D66
MGAAVPKPGEGTITGVTGNWCTLSTDFGNVTVPYPVGTTPTVGDLWKLVWQGGGFAVAPMSTGSATITPPPNPGGGVSNHVDTFNAYDAGSYSSTYGSGWSNPQVLSQDHWQGAWFYGTKIADTVPATAVIQKVEIHVSIQSQSAGNPTFALHNYASKPGGAPSYGTSQSFPLAGGWLTLPNS